MGRLQKVILADSNLSRGEHSFSTNTDNFDNDLYIIVTQIDGESNINKFTK